MLKKSITLDSYEQESDMASRRKEDGAFEALASETADSDSEKSRYEILTFPTDFTLQVLVDKYNRELITVPGYQRKFVWSVVKASRLVESFLLGLPVPPIYLYQEAGKDYLQVIDGQQRLKSVTYFFEGHFGEEKAGKRAVFRLTGLNEDSPYAGLTFAELEQNDPPSYHKLTDAPLRAFVIKQLNPKDNTSVFHIFERLNTGGQLLKGQEIRNCLCHGTFNDLMNQLNVLHAWRSTFGPAAPQKHQRDVELILRFFALHYARENYTKPMKDFLSDFMKANQNPPPAKLDEYRRLFESTAQAVHDALGPRPFHIRAGLNAAVFDAVFVAFARNANSRPPDLAARFAALLQDMDFMAGVDSATTDVDVVKKRLASAQRVLFP